MDARISLVLALACSADGTDSMGNAGVGLTTVVVDPGTTDEVYVGGSLWTIEECIDDRCAQALGVTRMGLLCYPEREDVCEVRAPDDTMIVVRVIDQE